MLHSQKGERKLPRKARRRGGRARKRGLSKEQVPVLLATARGGATVGQALESVTQASLQAALAPVLASDAVLVSDGGRAYPGCARRLGVQHEAVNVSAGRPGARELSHPNREQSAPTVEGVPRTVPGGGDEVSGQLPALVSGSRIGARGISPELFGGLDDTPMHTFR